MYNDRPLTKDISVEKSVHTKLKNTTSMCPAAQSFSMVHQYSVGTAGTGGTADMSGTRSTVLQVSVLSSTLIHLDSVTATVLCFQTVVFVDQCN